MILSELLKAIQPIQIIGSTETEITGVNIDSRLVLFRSDVPLGASRTSVHGYARYPD